MQVDPDAILPTILQQQPPALEPKRTPPPLPPPRRGTTLPPLFLQLKLTLFHVGSAGSSVEAPSGQMSISVKFSVVTLPLVIQLLSLFAVSCVHGPIYTPPAVVATWVNPCSRFTTQNAPYALAVMRHQEP